MAKNKRRRGNGKSASRITKQDDIKDDVPPPQSYTLLENISIITSTLFEYIINTSITITTLIKPAITMPMNTYQLVGGMTIAVGAILYTVIPKTFSLSEEPPEDIPELSRSKAAKRSKNKKYRMKKPKGTDPRSRPNTPNISEQEQEPDSTESSSKPPRRGSASLEPSSPSYVLSREADSTALPFTATEIRRKLVLGVSPTSSTIRMYEPVETDPQEHPVSDSTQPALRRLPVSLVPRSASTEPRRESSLLAPPSASDEPMREPESLPLPPSPASTQREPSPPSNHPRRTVRFREPESLTISSRPTTPAVESASLEPSSSSNVAPREPSTVEPSSSSDVAPREPPSRQPSPSSDHSGSTAIETPDWAPSVPTENCLDALTPTQELEALINVEAANNPDLSAALASLTTFMETQLRIAHGTSRLPALLQLTYDIHFAITTSRTLPLPNPPANHYVNARELACVFLSRYGLILWPSEESPDPAPHLIDRSLQFARDASIPRERYGEWTALGMVPPPRGSAQDLAMSRLGKAVMGFVELVYQLPMEIDMGADWTAVALVLDDAGVGEENLGMRIWALPEGLREQMLDEDVELGGR